MRSVISSYIKLAYDSYIKTMGDKILAYISTNLFTFNELKPYSVEGSRFFLHRLFYVSGLLDIDEIKKFDFKSLSKYINGRNIMIKSQQIGEKGIIKRGVTRVRVESLDDNRIVLRPSLYTNNLTRFEQGEKDEWSDQQSGSDHIYENPTNFYTDDMFRGDYSPSNDGYEDYYSDWSELPSMDYLITK